MANEIGIHISANAEELARFAAEQFVRLASEAQRERGLFTVALAGGSTPKTLYVLLASEQEPYRAQLDFAKIHFFWGDERHVSPDHPDSNYGGATEAMLNKFPVPLANVHRINSEMADAEEAARDYEQVLGRFFGLEKRQLPRFDLVLLGMGSDGHTASIFPGSDVINEKRRLVAAPWIEKLRSYRITLTPAVLNNAASIIILVSGQEKAKVLKEVLEGEYRPEYLPVQIIEPTDGGLLWLADREAAQLLKKSSGEDDAQP